MVMATDTYEVVSATFNLGGTLTEREVMRRFESAVSRRLRDGWMLVGGVSVVMDADENMSFYQAVAR